MDIQTEAMRQTPQKEVCAMQDIEGYYGIEYVNHPTPSGGTRMLPTCSDKRRFKTPEEAVQALKDILAQFEGI